jgi:DNA-binding CsgD family transcriptional regulator
VGGLTTVDLKNELRNARMGFERGKVTLMDRPYADQKMVQGRNAATHPGAFAFCDRVSGTMRFHVEAAPGGTLPVERAASLLAMHCLASGRNPGDFTVLVVPRGSLFDSVSERAQELLDAGRSISCALPLSSREREVLDFILQNLSNKEIGARLNLSVSTIKSNVSGLLAKFKVRDRVDLMRDAISRGLRAPTSVPPDTLFGFAMPPQKAVSEAESTTASERRKVVAMAGNARSR